MAGVLLKTLTILNDQNRIDFRYAWISHDAVMKHFEDCDEIWHAGDFGSISIAEKLVDGRKRPANFLKGVYGVYTVQRKLSGGVF